MKRDNKTTRPFWRPGVRGPSASAPAHVHGEEEAAGEAAASQEESSGSACERGGQWGWERGETDALGGD